MAYGRRREEAREGVGVGKVYKRKSAEGRAGQSVNLHGFHCRVCRADRGLDHDCMPQNQDGGRGNEPKDQKKRTGPPENRDADHEEGRIEGPLCDHVTAYLQRLRSKLIDSPKAADQEAESKQEPWAGDHAVQPENQNDSEVVPSKVARVVGDPLGSLGRAIRAADPVGVQELAWAAEPAQDGLCPSHGAGPGGLGGRLAAGITAAQAQQGRYCAGHS